MKTLAIIPARSGSKGLKDKNIIDLNGRPMIDYTIKAALESECFDKVMVSTDSEKYAEISKACGAEVPFLRSEATSTDTAGSWDVVREVLTRYEELGESFDYVCLLQATSPLRTAQDIQGAFTLLQKEGVTNVLAVAEADHPLEWYYKLDEEFSYKKCERPLQNVLQRQKSQKYHRTNGSIYIVDAKKIRNPEYAITKDNCYAYPMPRHRSIDIDELVDLIMAKSILEAIEEGLIK
ncbi:MAG: acylneuraminate cytidylyltransferase family protein [Clostridia bacterium]|nr:acylneuraminate cytidylyltransferase family protein [Clostridia bacterium]